MRVARLVCASCVNVVRECRERRVVSIHFYPKNVHQPWPLALKYKMHAKMQAELHAAPSQ